MDIIKITNVEKEENREKDYVHKGVRVFPDLKTAILANLRGFMNGSYKEPLTGIAKKLGYYPLSMATDQELDQINAIEKQVLGENK